MGKAEHLVWFLFFLFFYRRFLSFDKRYMRVLRDPKITPKYIRPEQQQTTANKHSKRETNLCRNE